MQVNSSVMWKQLRKVLRQKGICPEGGRKEVLQKSRWNSDLGTSNRQESI